MELEKSQTHSMMLCQMLNNFVVDLDYSTMRHCRLVVCWAADSKTETRLKGSGYSMDPATGTSRYRVCRRLLPLENAQTLLLTGEVRIAVRLKTYLRDAHCENSEGFAHC